MLNSPCAQDRPWVKYHLKQKKLLELAADDRCFSTKFHFSLLSFFFYCEQKFNSVLELFWIPWCPPPVFPSVFIPICQLLTHFLNKVTFCDELKDLLNGETYKALLNTFYALKRSGK